MATILHKPIEPSPAATPFSIHDLTHRLDAHTLSTSTQSRTHSYPRPHAHAHRHSHAPSLSPRSSPRHGTTTTTTTAHPRSQTPPVLLRPQHFSVTTPPPAITSLGPSALSYISCSGSAIRRHRQRALRDQCSRTHLRAIEALVESLRDPGDGGVEGPELADSAHTSSEDRCGGRMPCMVSTDTAHDAHEEEEHDDDIQSDELVGQADPNLDPDIDTAMDTDARADADANQVHAPAAISDDACTPFPAYQRPRRDSAVSAVGVGTGSVAAWRSDARVKKAAAVGHGYGHGHGRRRALTNEFAGR